MFDPLNVIINPEQLSRNRLQLLTMTKRLMLVRKLKVVYNNNKKKKNKNMSHKSNVMMASHGYHSALNIKKS
jgi:hypothetical protein